jgi:hypothetical protein
MGLTRIVAAARGVKYNANHSWLLNASEAFDDISAFFAKGFGHVDQVGARPGYRCGNIKTAAIKKTLVSGFTVKIYRVFLTPQPCQGDIRSQIHQFFLLFCLEEDIKTASVKTSVAKFIRKFDSHAQLPYIDQTYRWMVPSFPEKLDPAQFGYNDSFLMFITQFAAVQMNEAAQDISFIRQNTELLSSTVSAFRVKESEEKGKVHVLLKMERSCRVNWRVRYLFARILIDEVSCDFPLTGYRLEDEIEIDVSGFRHLTRVFRKYAAVNKSLTVTLLPSNTIHDVVLPNLFGLFKQMVKMDDSDLLKSGLSCLFKHFLSATNIDVSCDSGRTASRLCSHTELTAFHTPAQLERRDGVAIEGNTAQMRACYMVLNNTDCMVHIVGPPGTGKTALIACMIGTLVEACIFSRLAEQAELDDPPTVACIGAVLCETANSAANAAVKLARAGHNVVFVTSESRWYGDCAFHNIEELSAVCVYNLMEESLRPPQLQNTYRKAYESTDPSDLPTYAELKVESQSEFKKIIQGHQIIVTNISQAVKSGRLCFLEGLLDFIIIDEASQAHVHSVLLTVYLMRVPRFIFVGDPKQLGPLNKSGYAKALVVSAPSLMELAMRNSPAVTVQLNLQYRMPPDSCSIHSDMFYDSTVITAEPVFKALRSAPGANTLAVSLLCRDISLGVAVVKSDCSQQVRMKGTSKYNEDEADSVCNVLRLLVSHASVAPKDIAIITPYTAQVEVINKLLKRNVGGVNLDGLTVGVVNQLQGEERQYVLLSLVHADDAAATIFVSDDQRCNVALSRHRTLLVVFTNLIAWEGSPRFDSESIGFSAMQRFIKATQDACSIHDKASVRDWLSEIQSGIDVQNPDALRVSWLLDDGTYESASQWAVSQSEIPREFASLYRWFSSTMSIVRVPAYYDENGNMRYGFDVYSGVVLHDQPVHVRVFPFLMQSSSSQQLLSDLVQYRLTWAVSGNNDVDFMGYAAVSCDTTHGVPPILVCKCVNFIPTVLDIPLNLGNSIESINSLTNHLRQLVSRNMYHCDIGPHAVVYSGSRSCVRLVHLAECVGQGETVKTPSGGIGKRWNSEYYSTASEVRLTYAVAVYCLYCACPAYYLKWVSDEFRLHQSVFHFLLSKPGSTFGAFLSIVAAALEYKFKTLESLQVAFSDLYLV